MDLNAHRASMQPVPPQRVAWTASTCHAQLASPKLQPPGGYGAVSGHALTFLNPSAPPPASPLNLKQAQQLPVTSLELPAPLTGQEVPASPKSLCSTVAAQPKGGGHERRDSLWASDLHESLARLSSRVDAALADVQSEVAHIAKECAAGAAQLEALEQRVDAAKDDHFAYAIRVQALERDFVEVRASGAAHAEALERGLASGAEARQELERNLGKELREQIAQEAERVHGAVMREMRERVDGQKSLRDDAQFQQQTLMRLTSRLDEVVMELRAELPRLSQEHVCQKADTDKLQAQQLSLQSRLDSIDQSVSDEAAARVKSERGLSEEVRKFVTADMVRIRTETAELLQRIDEMRTDLRGASAKAESAHDRLERLAGQASKIEEDLHAALEDLQRRAAQAEAEIRGVLDSRVLESETGLRNWVSSTVAARLSAIEGSLRPRVPERASMGVTPVQMRPAPTVVAQPRPMAFIPG